MPRNYKFVKEWIREHEGFRDTAYNDSLGKLTIGVGHLITRTSPFYKIKDVETRKLRVTRAGDAFPQGKLLKQYDKDFRHHMEIAKENCKKATKHSHRFNSHPVHVQDALINMAFQLGTAPRRWTNFMKHLSQQEYALAGYHAADSKWFKIQTTKRAKSVLDRLVLKTTYTYTRPRGLKDYWSRPPT